MSCGCDKLNSRNGESIWGKIITGNNYDILVGICYKSPSAENSEVDELFDTTIEASKFHVLIMGISTFWK